MAFEAIYRYGEQARIDHTPSRAVAAGEVVVLSDDLIGIATEAIGASAKGSLCTRGVFDVAKDTTSGTAFTEGEQVFWDEANNVAVNAVGAHKFLGYAVAAAADSASTVRVLVERQAGSLA